MAIEAGIPHSQLQHIAIEAGMIQLLQVRLEQTLTGRTLIEEVYFRSSGDRRSGDVKAIVGGRRIGDVLKK